MKNKIIKFAIVLIICSPVVLIPLYHMNEEVAMADYTALDGTYSVTMPEGMLQRNMTDSVMVLDGTSRDTYYSAIALSVSKSAIANCKSTSLEEFGSSFENIGGISANWEKEMERQTDSLQRGIFKEGTVTQNGSVLTAMELLGESENKYYGLLVFGMRIFSDGMKEQIAITSLEKYREKTVKDYIMGLSAIDDVINGFNAIQVARWSNETYLYGGFQDVDKIGKKISQENYEQTIKNARQTLKSRWEIVDNESLHNEVNNILKTGLNQKSLEFLLDYDVEKTVNREEIVTRLESGSLAEPETIKLLAIYDAKAMFGDNAIKAWDLSRIPTIMGLGYAAGYCTYIEALNASLEAAILAQQSFDSWEEFNQSYLYGYSFWSGESLETPGSSAYERQQIVETLESEENGPFSVDWNLTLEKEW